MKKNSVFILCFFINFIQFTYQKHKCVGLMISTKDFNIPDIMDGRGNINKFWTKYSDSEPIAITSEENSFFLQTKNFELLKEESMRVVGEKGLAVGVGLKKFDFESEDQNVARYELFLAYACPHFEGEVEFTA